MILANQDAREPLKSAADSIPVTAGYAPVFILFCGWLLGIPGELGFGHIHLGLITYALSGVTVTALMLRSRLINRPAGPPAPAAAVAGPPAYGKQKWTVSVALTIILRVPTKPALPHHGLFVRQARGITPSISSRAAPTNTVIAESRWSLSRPASAASKTLDEGCGFPVSFSSPASAMLLAW